MKFFHLSDLHIGLKLMNRDLREDQEYILEEIVKLAIKEKPDAVVIAGDIYDKSVPSSEAVEIFDHFIQKLTASLPDIVIMMISGNHDSAQRINCFRSVLSRQKIYMVGIPPQTVEERIEKVTLEDAYGKVNFYLLPFVKPSMVKKIVSSEEEGALSYEETIRRLMEREELDDSERNVIVSHQFYLPVGKKPEEIERMDSEIRVVGNIDEVSAKVLEKFDYAALGHIHKPMNVGSSVIRYCGTPLACSVSEAGQKKGIIMVELGKKEEPVKTTILPLLPLREVRIVKGELEEVLHKGSMDYVTVILTEKEELDAIDLQDRIRMAFPNLLELRREHLRKTEYGRTAEASEILNPYELCCAFLKELDEEEKKILQDVIQTVQGGK